jgi:hypothetical protein
MNEPKHQKAISELNELYTRFIDSIFHGKTKQKITRGSIRYLQQETKKIIKSID